MATTEIVGGARGGLWNFSATNTDTTTAPVKGRFRTNTGTYRNATQIAIHAITEQGIDRTNTLQSLLTDDIIECQDLLATAAWCRYVLQSPPINKGGWFQLNVALEADGNVKSGENQEVIVLFTANSNALATIVYAETTTYLQTTAQMVGALDTVPQQSDGTQLLTASITPKRASNKLRIQSRIPFSATSPAALWFALFRDSTPAAFTAAVFNAAQNSAGQIAVLESDISVGSTAPTTIMLRYGNVKGVNQTIAVNGSGTARWLGGASRATLSITEHE